MFVLYLLFYVGFLYVLDRITIYLSSWRWSNFDYYRLKAFIDIFF